MHIKPSSFQARDWKLHSLLCKDTKIYRIRHLSMKSWFIFPHQSLSLVLQMLLCEFTDKIKEHGKYLQIDIKHPLLGSYHIKRYKYFFYFQGRRKKIKPWKDKPPTHFLILLFFSCQHILIVPNHFKKGNNLLHLVSLLTWIGLSALP